MKKILFLLLFPSLALAQYQGNANQKITLGEQTTADGLVWRGLRADTTSKIVPFSDTSAYIILDTVEKTLWLYKAGQVPKWQQVGGSTLDTATMLLPYYRAGRNTIIQAADVPTLNQNTTGSAATLTTGRTIQTNLASTSAATFNGSANITPGVTGTLPVANGGTNRTTMPEGYILHGDGTSVDTAIGLFWDRTNKRLAVGTTTPGVDFEIFRSTGQPQFVCYNGTNWVGLRGDEPLISRNSGKDLLFVTYTTYPTTGATVQMTLQSNGKLKIGDLAGINDVGADANGVLQAASSDINLKNTIESSPFGLNEILLLNPVTFLYNDENRKIDSDVKEVGFIAQDVFDIIPNAVSSIANGDLQLDYRAITATLVKAIQEQNMLIKALEQRILILENK